VKRIIVRWVRAGEPIRTSLTHCARVDPRRRQRQHNRVHVGAIHRDLTPGDLRHHCA
jgi:hypothetical protein